MSKIQRLLLDTKLINSIKPVKGTLSFTSLSPEKVSVLCNLYNYFVEEDKIKAIFSLRKLYQICYPNEAVNSENGERLNYKLLRFKDLLMEIESQRYSYPVRNGKGISVINERLFKLVIISRPENGSELEDKIEIMTPDHRIQHVYELTGSENIKDEFNKHTKIEKNYIETIPVVIPGLKGRQVEKAKKIQQVLDEVIATKGIRLKKRQAVEMSTIFNIEEMSVKMGDLKDLKKNKTRYLQALSGCMAEIAKSEYPVKSFELLPNKTLIITFDPLRIMKKANNLI